MTLNPELIADVRKQVKTWNEESLNPWIPSSVAEGFVQIIRNRCPRMAMVLEAAGIFEPWAEMIHDRIWELARSNRRAGMTIPGEAESEGSKELVPSNWRMQEEWLAANCLDYQEEPEPYGLDDPRHSQFSGPNLDEPDDGSDDNSTDSVRAKCATRFATWLKSLPQLADWEEKRFLVADLNLVADRLGQKGASRVSGLPNLRQMGPQTVEMVAAWMEAAMDLLEVEPPEDWADPETTPLEKMQALVDLLLEKVAPPDPDR